MQTKSQLKLLVVDDNHDCADTLSALLERQGFIVRAVYDCDAALLALTEFEPNAIVLNVCMPQKEDGFCCCEDLREQRPDQTIIGVTGCQMDMEFYDRAVKSGFSYLFQKPVDVTRVGELIALDKV